MLETFIDIEAIAPSDIEVAGYIARLSSLKGTMLSGGPADIQTRLLRDVELVLSEEYKIDDEIYRKFKLKAILTKGVYLSAKDVDRIRGSRLTKLFDHQKTVAKNNNQLNVIEN